MKERAWRGMRVWRGMGEEEGMEGRKGMDEGEGMEGYVDTRGFWIGLGMCDENLGQWD